jgi:hypothetical protein
MPYSIKHSGSGYKVHSPNRSFSKKPLSKKKAQAQMRAIYANTKGESFEQKLDRILMDGIMSDTDSNRIYIVIWTSKRGMTYERSFNNITEAEQLRTYLLKHPTVKHVEDIIDRTADQDEQPPVTECMDHDELVQRATAFRNSIARGKITLDQIEKSMLGWVKADFITPEQVQELVQLIKQGDHNA